MEELLQTYIDMRLREVDQAVSGFTDTIVALIRRLVPGLDDEGWTG